MVVEGGDMDRKRTAVWWVLAIGSLVVLGGCTFFSQTKAVIDVSVTAGIVPLTVSFSADQSTSDAGISTVLWSFGTGEQSYDATGNYTYRHAGRYTLTLTVRSEDGGTDTESIEIVVEPAAWICDENLDRVYKLDMNGAVLETINLSVPEPMGLTVAEVAGESWLFVACRGGGSQRILKVDPETGAMAEQYVAPGQNPLFMTYGADEIQRLWHVDGLSRKIYELNPSSGQVLDSFGTNYFRASQQIGNETFLQTPYGLCWEGSGGPGRLWYLEGETGLLYAIEIHGAIDIFQGTQLEIDVDPIAVDPTLFPIQGMDLYDGVLWVVQRDEHRIIAIDPLTGQRTGGQITGFPGAMTSGLAIQR